MDKFLINDMKEVKEYLSNDLKIKFINKKLELATNEDEINKLKKLLEELKANNDDEVLF